MANTSVPKSQRFPCQIHSTNATRQGCLHATSDRRCSLPRLSPSQGQIADAACQGCRGGRQGSRVGHPAGAAGFGAGRADRGRGSRHPRHRRSGSGPGAAPCDIGFRVIGLGLKGVREYALQQALSLQLLRRTRPGCTSLPPRQALSAKHKPATASTLRTFMAQCTAHAVLYGSKVDFSLQAPSPICHFCNVESSPLLA